jgi:hypothetical protein
MSARSRKRSGLLRARVWRLGWPAFVALLCALSCSSAALAQSLSRSENWAGYAVTAATPFRRVVGEWIQPAPRCTPGRESFSAFWVGLGGFLPSSRKLEQIGTDSDCGRGGRVRSYAWYELIPAGPVNLPLVVRPGDRLAASVTVGGRFVALHIRDLRDGAAINLTRRMRSPDLSSAEWIAEAPTGCEESGCRVLPLANFGSVTFSNAQSALVGAPPAPLASTSFQRTRLDLAAGGTGSSGLEENASANAPSLLASAGSLLEGGTFTVSYE